ncbi:unnamed protein product, partial [Amoebophrya sp. A25]
EAVADKKSATESGLIIPPLSPADRIQLESLLKPFVIGQSYERPSNYSNRLSAMGGRNSYKLGSIERIRQGLKARTFRVQDIVRIFSRMLLETSGPDALNHYTETTIEQAMRDGFY